MVLEILAAGVGADQVIPGIAGFGLATPMMWALWQMYKREVQLSDESRAEVRRLNEVIQEKALPAALEVAAALKEEIAYQRETRRRHDK
jgi:hypothetical protein